MIDGNAVDFTMDALNIIEFPKQYIHSQTDRKTETCFPNILYCICPMGGVTLELCRVS